MDYRSEAVTLLSNLVAIPSVSTQPAEADLGAFVEQYCRALGMEVERQYIDDIRFNVVAKLTLGTGQGKTVVLNSHMDVVPAAEGWDTDPFQLTVKDDGRAYGRGATDAKGCLTALMVATKAIAQAPGDLNGTVILTGVADEESQSRGARAVVERADVQAADYGIVGEPTECRVALGHNGSLRPFITIHGRTAHSSTPDLGISAVRVAAYMSGLVDQRQAHLRQVVHPTTGRPSISITILRADVKENVLPDYCEMVIDRRMVPGEREAEIIADLELLCRQAEEAFPGAKVAIDHYLMTTGPASEVAADSEIARIAYAACEQVTGQRQTPFGLTCNTDMNHFVRAGIPTVIIGPNIIDICHKPNEYVELEQLETACRVDEAVIRALLRGGAPSQQT